MTRYRTIVADPPWQQRGGPTLKDAGVGEGFAYTEPRRSGPLPYPTMSVEAIKALPVGALADENCHLYLWATNKYLPAAFDVMKAWGFRYSSTQTWCKNLMGGGLGGTFRISSEFFLFGYRGRCDAVETVPGTWFRWRRPYDSRGKPRHSAKPPEFFEAVERASHEPRLELFARDARRGWDCWGNEVDSDVEMAS